jgi:hypothetical protein
MERRGDGPLPGSITSPRRASEIPGGYPVMQDNATAPPNRSERRAVRFAIALREWRPPRAG